MQIIRVDRLNPDGRGCLGQPLWLAIIGEEMPPLSQVGQLYLRRFAIDHWSRKDSGQGLDRRGLWSKVVI